MSIVVDRVGPDRDAQLSAAGGVRGGRARRRAWPTTRRCTRARRRIPRGSGREVAGELDVGDAVDAGARLEAARREVVRRRQAQRQRTTASTGTSRRGARTRRRSSGRASRATRACSPTSSCTARCASSPNALEALGVETGDRVAIYMPMIPEAAIAMLACARIGATHSVVFGGFSAEALARPHQRREGEGRHHRRRRLAARRRSCRSRPTSTRRSTERRRSRTCSSSSAATNDGRDGRRAATSGGTTSSTTRRRLHERERARQRAPALHPLHERHDRQAEGHPAHDRRLPARRVATRRSWSST